MQVNTPLNDYSHQWLEYYRSLGMIREAELLEQQISINHESQGQMLQQEYVGYQQGYLGDNQQEYLNVYQQEYLNHNQQENLEQNQQQQLHAEPKYEPISPDSDVIEITDAKDCEQQKQLQQQQLHQQQLQQQQLQQQQLQQQQLQQQKQEEQKNEQEVMQLIQKLQQIEQQQKIQRLQQEQQKQATEMQFKLRLLLEYCQRVLETQVLEQHSKEHKAKESELKTWQQEQEYDQQNYSEQQLQLGKIYETASTSTSLQEDYTDQWIEYYRTIGQTKEAEILEYNKRLKVAAKIKEGGSKRPLEEGQEPNAKKLASVDQGYQQPMSATAQAAAAAAAATARIAASGGNGSGGGGPGNLGGINPSGIGGTPTPNIPLDQAQNEYIRVPDKMVGLIIGRGGEQITRLQAESGCKIQMAPDAGGQADRVCTLTGTREAITRAKELVNLIVNHRGRENAPQHQDNREPMGGGGTPGGPGGPGVPGGPSSGGGMPRGGGLACTDEIMIPGPKVGLIIGKNGKTIKQLQEQSGAKMVVIQEGPNTEYEKPLRITGEQGKVEHAKQLVFELLAEKDLQFNAGPRSYEDPYQQQEQGNGLATNSAEVLVPKIAVGVVIGRGGDMIKKIQVESGCRVQFHQERDEGPGDKRCYLQGKPHQVDQARQMIEDLIESVNRREQENRMKALRGDRGGGGGQRNGDRGGDFGQQWQQDQPEVRVTFTVSNVKCGLIIGRGGEVIKQINAQSGAHCELDRRAQGSDRNNRTFFIKGHPEAVENCKRIITEKVGMPVNFIDEGVRMMGGGGGGGGVGGGGGGGGAGAPGGDYYGGGGGAPPGQGPAAWGYNPHWHPANNQQRPQQQQVPVNPLTGQPDYSQQWIEYYRAMGMVREAEAIEQQAKQQQQQAQQQQQQQQQPQAQLVPPESTSPTGSMAGSVSSAAGAAAPQADYSAQWAEYYRSLGKIKEAEAIEAQIKIKQQQGQLQTQAQVQGQPANAAATGAPGGPGAPMMTGGPGGQYAPQYPMAYPGAPMPYPGYQPYPYPGGPGIPQAPTPDPHQQ